MVQYLGSEGEGIGSKKNLNTTIFGILNYINKDEKKTLNYDSNRNK
jgi:hypothetical protein